MLIGSAALLLTAMALGALLLLARFRQGWGMRLAHGGAGAAGLALFLVAWERGAVRGAVVADAIGLLIAGLALGLYLLRHAWLGLPPAGLVVFLHLSLAGFGALLAAGFVLG